MDFIKQALRFCLPWACAGCGTALAELDDVGFCGPCWLSIPRIEGLVCQICGLPLPQGGGLCFSCREKPLRLRIRAATTYQGPVPRAIHRFKYAGRTSLVNPFSVLLSAAMDRFFPYYQSVDYLVPVPLHPHNQKARGYNQAQLLAKALSRRLHVPVADQMLFRTRKTRPQFELTRMERQSNLRNAFAVSQKIPIKTLSLLLIDDICTTGATLAECAQALRRAHAGRVEALVLARDL